MRFIDIIVAWRVVKAYDKNADKLKSFKLVVNEIKIRENK
jgi:hypothetical protein